MKEYIEEHQNIMKTFSTNREYPNRPGPSPLAKKPKTTPTKRRCMETRQDIKKLCKPRKKHKWIL